MLVLTVAALVGLVVAAGVAVAARRWPRVDLAAPSAEVAATEMAEHPDEGGHGEDEHQTGLATLSPRQTAGPDPASRR